jgi:hypothetical protein
LVEIEHTGQQEAVRLIFYVISKLASSENRAVANSPAHTKKRDIRELPTTVNDCPNVISCVVPNDIGWSERHDSLGPPEFTWVFLETGSLG